MSAVLAWLLCSAVAVWGGDGIRRRWMPGFGANGPGRLAAAWLLGQLALGFIAVGCLALGIHPAWAAPTLLVGAVAEAAARRRGGDHSVDDYGADSGDLGLRILAGGCALLAVAVAARTHALGWDGLAIWGLKARTVAELGAIPWAEWRLPGAVSMHPEYPLHVPVLGAAVAGVAGWLGGAWDDRFLPLLAALDVAGIAAVLAAAWERHPVEPGLRWAIRALLAGGLLVPLTWRELPEGKADLTLAFCVLSTVAAAAAWLRDGDRDALRFAAVAAGLGAWTKQEGLVWLALAALWVAALTPANRRRVLLGPALLAGGIAAPWHGFRLLTGLEAEPFAVDADAAARLPRVLSALAGELLEWSRWGALWPAALVATVAVIAAGVRRPRRDAYRAELFPALFLANALAALVVIFLATPHDLDWHLATALSRVLLPLWPAALLVTGAALTRLAQRWQPGQ
ncbi:MAG: hypothetical protein AAGF23_20710 [Acidobacteriota bacterium]